MKDQLKLNDKILINLNNQFLYLISKNLKK